MMKVERFRFQYKQFMEENEVFSNQTKGGIIMTKPKVIDETEIYDRENGLTTIRPGSSVNLLPVSLRVDTIMNKEFPPGKVFNFLEGILGIGPYLVSWIGQWPCGRILLYFKEGDLTSGCCASHFMRV
ncbi:MAG: hypothetical protein U9P50_01600 [Patescibacteria group bacterium]|nr:hypothetical protein [Patescibacteria group bacterium]